MKSNVHEIITVVPDAEGARVLWCRCIMCFGVRGWEVGLPGMRARVCACHDWWGNWKGGGWGKFIGVLGVKG